jgi:hypothetical protein
MADKPPRKWLQFRLQTILWLMLLIAVGLGTYWRGYQAGRADLANQRTEVGSMYVKVYNVADVMPTQKSTSGIAADLKGLAREICSQVLPNTWEMNGGTASVIGIEPSISLVVSHDQDGHERIAAYLQRLRAKKQQQLRTSK